MALPAHFSRVPSAPVLGPHQHTSIERILHELFQRLIVAREAAGRHRVEKRIEALARQEWEPVLDKQIDR